MPYDPIPYTVNVNVCNVLKHRILYVIATLSPPFFPFIQRSIAIILIPSSRVSQIGNILHLTSILFFLFF